MTMKEHSIDQIWYTWSTVGVDNLPLRGGYFRVRAASRDRSDLQGEFFQRFIRPHLDYRLPQGIDPYTISLEKSPVCLAFINSPYGKLLIHKVYAGNDGFNRPGNFFTHILFGLPENFSARDAIRLWKSPIWQTRDDPEQPIQLKPLLLDKLKLTEQSFDFISIEDQLGQLIHAYLAPDRLQKRVLITGTSEQVAALIWGLTHSIPTTLLPPYFTFISYENNPTFISYENNPDRFNKTLIGTTTSHQLEIS